MKRLRDLLHIGRDHRHLCTNAWCQLLERCGCVCYRRTS